jgi:cell division protein FtsZ
MNNLTPPPSGGEAQSGFLRITVIGVGHAGSKAVERMAREAWSGVRYAAVSTHAQALAQIAVPEKQVLAGKRRHGLGTGGDPEEGRASAEADLEALKGLCGGAEIVFLVAGLGGGTGSGVAPVLARTARDLGALVLAVGILPFDWEGARRLRQAQEALSELKSQADSVICVSNQRLYKLIDENTSVIDTFDLINEHVAEGARSLWRLLTQPALLRVDFADLCQATRGRHSESVLACAEASGVNRSRELAERLLAHPLLDRGQILAEAEMVLISLLGGRDLTMAEAGRLIESVRRHAEDAHFIVGTAVDEKLGDRLHATVVVTRRPAPVESSPEAVEAARGGVAGAGSDHESAPHFLRQASGRRTPSRFVPPPPMLSPEQQEQYLAKHIAAKNGLGRKLRLQQGTLPLEIVSKGRFEKSEPTLYRGEDLDIPTYVRRGVALN